MCFFDLHITLCGVDVIKQRLNSHPFDRNSTLQIKSTNIMSKQLHITFNHVLEKICHPRWFSRTDVKLINICNTINICLSIKKIVSPCFSSHMNLPHRRLGTNQSPKFSSSYLQPLAHSWQQDLCVQAKTHKL